MPKKTFNKSIKNAFRIFHTIEFTFKFLIILPTENSCENPKDLECARKKISLNAADYYRTNTTLRPSVSRPLDFLSQIFPSFTFLMQLHMHINDAAKQLTGIAFKVCASVNLAESV
ncbi:CLUMA_CG016037, isoform A [Clunio marinus]|uniref:CLUMA_CG016037, isoform A n=1 Tax=Clunio marinus TaxID=568069 RepID=A0A1J1IQZ8_9DIPT|nr:CLUMA_CG016037, isoform A [Clunio marinus]